VDRLTRNGERFAVSTGERTFEAENVVVAMANYQEPWKPPFAADLDPGILQVHSYEYRNPAQLRDGAVLIVGAGNSGSELAMELAKHGKVFMAGRNTGQLPFRIESDAARRLWINLTLRFLFHRLLTVNTPMGRKIRPKVITRGGPLIRVKQEDLARAGVERTPGMVGVKDGRPLLDDGRVLDVTNVVWCTGFRPGFSWIDLPVHSDHEPQHKRGVVPGQPGLFFVGLHFLYGLSSSMIHGVGRDAAYIAEQIVARSKSPVRSASLNDYRDGAPIK
jgi:putative flavoprotein involved in K+ transport